MRVLYFAWVRERIGKAEEDIALPDQVRTVADLVTVLAARGEEYAYAFENPAVVRCALDQVHGSPESSLEGVREVAFFPPMTGG